jgi:hypothetical protein
VCPAYPAAAAHPQPQGNSSDDLAKTKTDYEAFLGNADMLTQVGQVLSADTPYMPA